MSLLLSLRTLRRIQPFARYFSATQSKSSRSKQMISINNFKELVNFMLKSLNDADLEINKLLLQNLRLELSTEEEIISQLEALRSSTELGWFKSWLLRFLTEKDVQPFPITLDELSPKQRQQLAFELAVCMFAVKAPDTPIVKRLFPRNDWRKLEVEQDDFSNSGHLRLVFNTCRRVAATLSERIHHEKLKELISLLRSCHSNEISSFEMMKRIVTLFSLHLDTIEPMLQVLLGTKKVKDMHTLISVRNIRREHLRSDLRYELFYLLRRRELDMKQQAKSAAKQKLESSRSDDVKSPAENAENAQSALMAHMLKYTENKEIFFKQRLSFGNNALFQLQLNCYPRAMQYEPAKKYRILNDERSGREQLIIQRVEELERIDQEIETDDFDVDNLFPSSELESNENADKMQDNVSIDDYNDNYDNNDKNNESMEHKFAMFKEQFNLSSDRKILLTNLPDNATEETVRELLVNCGGVQSVQIYRHFIDDPNTNINKGKSKEEEVEGETLSLSSLPSYSQLHATDDQEVAESLIDFDHDVEEKLQKEHRRQLAHQDDINDFHTHEESEGEGEESNEEEDNKEGDEKSPSKEKAKRIRRFNSLSLKYKTVARAPRTDTYAIVIMEDDAAYERVTKPIARLFGFSFEQKSCIPIPAAGLKHFFVECRHGMRVSDVLYALDVFLEGQFDCFLCRNVMEKLKPVYLKLRFQSHEDAALAFYLLAQNEALIETTEQSRLVDRTKLWGVTWIRPARYWEIARRSNTYMESLDMEANEILNKVLYEKEMNVKLGDNTIDDDSLDEDEIGSKVMTRKMSKKAKRRGSSSASTASRRKLSSAGSLT